MVTSVNTNVNALAAVQALTDISNSLTQTQAAVQSGLKVGGAADNPAVFTIAQGLRGNINALTAVSDSLATGVATLQAQTQGATSISNALNTLLQTVTQGQNTTDTAALKAINTTITNALANIDAFANATTINNVNLLGTAGSLSVLGNVNGTSVTVTTTAASTSTGLGLSALQLTTAGTTLTQKATAPANGDTITFTPTGSTKTTTFEFTDGTGALATVPTATKDVVAVQLSANSVSETIGNLLTALQKAGVTSSEDSNGVVTVSGGTATASATGFTAAATTNNGPAAITSVKTAIASIGATLSKLGSATLELQGLQNFTSQLQASVKTGLGAIVDANLSEESAKLSSLQTKQSLAIQSLSIANQGPGALLQLFR